MSAVGIDSEEATPTQPLEHQETNETNDGVGYPGRTQDSASAEDEGVYLDASLGRCPPLGSCP
jgi:hypothetical protein